VEQPKGYNMYDQFFKYVTVDVMSGSSISRAINEAKQMSQTLNGMSVKFTFNGIPISIDLDSDIEYEINRFNTKAEERYR
jgi:hypothetical protein